MPIKEATEAAIQKDYELHHLASFIEGENILKPDDVVRHIHQLQKSNRIDETPCEVRLDPKGVRVRIIDTKETVEYFEWKSIKDQAAILNSFCSFKYPYFVLFRCSQFITENRRLETELHVFSCETTQIAKSLVDSMSYYKKEAIKNRIEEKLRNHSTIKLRRGRSEERLNYAANDYEKYSYKLNRCIDDIENFERKLVKVIKQKASHQNIGDYSLTNVTIPTAEEAIETIKKVKCAFNINETIRPYISERISKQIFIRLFNTVQWLDEICKHRYLVDYDDDLVSKVKEPLLEGRTVKAIMDRLPMKKREFWKSLGPSWNTSPDQWSSPVNSYSSDFNRREQAYNFDTSASAISLPESNIRISHASSMHNLLQSPTPQNAQAKTPEPINGTDQAIEFCRHVDQANGRLCYATMRHVSAKPGELTVQPGTILELIESKAGDWWTVRDQDGNEGQVPEWKLKYYDINSTNSLPTQKSNQMNVDAITISSPSPIADQYSEIEIKSSSKLKGNDVKIRGYQSDSDLPMILTKSDVNTSYVTATSSTNVTHSNAHNNDEHQKSENQSSSSTFKSTTETLRVSTAHSPILDQPNKSTSITQNPDVVVDNTTNNKFVFMTPQQLQKVLESNLNLGMQTPMILVPVTNFYNLTNQPNYQMNNKTNEDILNWQNYLNMNIFDQNNVNLNNTNGNGVLQPGDGLDLTSATSTSNSSAWKPAPITAGTGTLSFSQYPFNYPTHMHTMTRELRERLSKMQQGGGSGLKSVPTPSTSINKPDSRLTKYASANEVAEWLIAHKFPPRAIAALRGFNGMDLYTMNPTQLEQHVGPERCDELFYAFRGS